MLEDLLVYRKALAAAHAVSILLSTPAFERDPELKSQLNRPSVRVVSDIAEGFTQKTDRHFAKYLYDSREVRGKSGPNSRLLWEDSTSRAARRTGWAESYAEIARMLTGLIRHLNEADWKQRR